MSNLKNILGSIISREPVLIVVTILAVLTCFFIPIDKEYLKYFEYNTLISLFCILIVVAGLKNTNVFDFISRKVISLFNTRRKVIMALVFGIFFFDMIIANDMSLITFLPLTYLVLHSTGNDKYLAYTFILQTIATNMGGMITPYGNPQNLYLYSYYDIPVLEFVSILIVQSLVSLLLLFIFCMFIKNDKLEIINNSKVELDNKKLIIYGTLFICTILSIFRIIPCILNLIIVIVVVLIVDKQRFFKVDYALILTFIVFFIFAGNMARIDSIKEFITSIISGNLLISGIISCQLISNVPTSIFLSHFTQNYRELVVSVNIGSLGILISSLASLITLKEFLKHQHNKFWSYLGKFTIINLVFLLVLLGITLLIK